MNELDGKLKKISLNDRERIIRAWDEGASVKYIAECMDVSKKSIRSVLAGELKQCPGSADYIEKMSKFLNRGDNNRKINKEDWYSIYADNKSGNSIVDLAKDLNVHRNTIARIIKLVKKEHGRNK